MYWYSETKKETAIDWRPEVHDSDGLEMWSGSGERLWRPLNNPPRIMVSAFLDNNPRGFGLMQRDRVFDHYLDGVYYDRRPSLWVEPMPGPQGEGWGKGSMQLCEIPTDDEIHDNVVAMWVPENPCPPAPNSTSTTGCTGWRTNPIRARCALRRDPARRWRQPGLPRPKGVRKFWWSSSAARWPHSPIGVTARAGAVGHRAALHADYRVIEAGS